MRCFDERVTRFRPLQTFGYWFQFMIVTSVLQFPLAVYEGYFREWKYGLATQTFGPWLWDQTKGLLIGIILGGSVVMVLMWVVRKLPRTWHVWGAVVSTIFMILGC
jgi:STE24 endopeptidase